MAGAGGGGHATAMMGQNHPTTSANDRQLNAANQELLRAADAAQIDLNSRLALLQVTRPFCPAPRPDFFFSNELRRLLRHL